jgi:hypothetical protein
VVVVLYLKNCMPTRIFFVLLFEELTPICPSILGTPSEELLVFHRAPPLVADGGMLTRYGR